MTWYEDFSYTLDSYCCIVKAKSHFGFDLIGFWKKMSLNFISGV